MGSTGDDDASPIERLRAFVDASVLIPSAISERGTSRDLLEAGRRGKIDLTVSRDVLDEAERNLRRKAPHALDMFWEQRDRLIMVEASRDLIVEVARLIEAKDAPVVAGAIVAGAGFLVTFDRRHLLGEAELIRQAYGIEVVTPGYLVARLSGLELP